MKTTYSLEQLVNTICRDDKEVEAVHTALKLVLYTYQWPYQEETGKRVDTAKNKISKAEAIITEHLRDLGNETLAEELSEFLAEDGYVLSKRKFLSKVKKLMENSLTKTIKPSRYREFNKLMEEAFIEHCDKYPLKSEPSHYELDRIAERKQTEYEDLQEFNPYK